MYYFLGLWLLPLYFGVLADELIFLFFYKIKPISLQYRLLSRYCFQHGHVRYVSFSLLKKNKLKKIPY